MKSAPLVAVTCLVVFLYGCASDQQKQQQDAKEKAIELTIRNPKVEIAEDFERMVQAYEQENPEVSVTVETIGGKPDNFSDIKAQIAAGEGPDIFTNTGGSSTEEWSAYLEDLSSEPWVKDAKEGSLDAITRNNRVLGMPLALESFGIIYNKEIFQQAGVTTLPTTMPQLQEAVAKLEAIGVQPFANGYFEEWKLGYHLPGALFEQNRFIRQLPDTKQKTIYEQFISFLDFTVKHGNVDATKTDYFSELEMFFNGEAAMVVQGNWIQPLLTQEAADMSVGMFAIPFTNTLPHEVVTGVPSYWVINKQVSPEKKRMAKHFLRWMVTSETAQEFMTKDFGFIPAWKTIESRSVPSTITIEGTRGKIDSKWYFTPTETKDRIGQVLKSYTNRKLSKEATVDFLMGL